MGFYSSYGYCAYVDEVLMCFATYDEYLEYITEER